MKILMCPLDAAMEQTSEYRSNVIEKSIDICRDDGFAILQNVAGPQIEQKRKNIKMFKTASLSITIQAGLHIVNFVDVQFKLNNEPTSHTENLTTPLFTSTKNLTTHQ